MDKSVFFIGGFPLNYNIIWFQVTQVMYYSFREQIFLGTLWSLALARKSCNNINNSRPQVSRLYYFLWLCFKLLIILKM